jgi:hypothetical protein
VLEHIGRTVDPDQRLRVFYAGPIADAPFEEAREWAASVDVGLVVSCRKGQLQLPADTMQLEGANLLAQSCTLMADLLCVSWVVHGAEGCNCILLWHE